MRVRRFWKLPESIKRKFRKLLLTTELSTEECRRRCGISSGTAMAIGRECRRSIGPCRWINLQTGVMHPIHPTGLAPVATALGVSRRTIGRRIKEGAVKPARAGLMYAWRASDVAKLRRIGRKKTGPHSLSPVDIRLIRQLSKVGIEASELARQFGVSPRHIRRIRTGTRWKELAI